MTSLLPVLSVSGLLLLGFAVGKILPPSVLRQMLKPLSAVVLLLLFLMGAEFGGIFTDKALGADVVKRALLLSSLIAAFTAALLYRKGGRAAPSGSFWPPFFGCLKVVAVFAAGVAAYRLLPHGTLEGVIGSTQVLYLLIFLVGTDFGACPPGRPEPARIPAAPVCSGGHGGRRFGFFPPDAVFVRPKPDAVGRLRLVFPVGADGGRTGVCRNGRDGFDDRFFSRNVQHRIPLFFRQNPACRRHRPFRRGGDGFRAAVCKGKLRAGICEIRDCQRLYSDAGRTCVDFGFDRFAVLKR